MKRLLVFAISACLLPCNLVSGGAVKEELERAYGKALAGDIRPILAVLDSIENVAQSEYAGLHDKFQERFTTQDERIEFDDPFITRLYAIYTAYWRTSLLDPESEKASRRLLLFKLDGLSKELGRKAGLLESITGPNVKKLELFLIICKLPVA